MGKLINGRTPEEIKERAATCITSTCSECPYDRTEYLCDVTDVMDNLLAYAQHLETKQPKWISVKDRLPEQNGDYLIHYRFKRQNRGKGFYSVCFYERTCEKPHFHNEGYCGMYVTHWMPLPEPPKEEAHENA